MAAAQGKIDLPEDGNERRDALSDSSEATRYYDIDQDLSAACPIGDGADRSRKRKKGAASSSDWPAGKTLTQNWR